jgi:hypothetical protein
MGEIKCRGEAWQKPPPRCIKLNWDGMVLNYHELSKKVELIRRDGSGRRVIAMFCTTISYITTLLTGAEELRV